MAFCSFEIDETSYVTEIIDGDSFKIQGDEVRLADVSCPEYYQPGGSEATQKLTDLINERYIYLDTDQQSGRDPYGRLVAVVYVEFNSTHLLNVNAAMWSLGYAEVTDYTNNEFDPYTWTLYEEIEPSTQESTITDTDFESAYYALADVYDSLVEDYNDLVVDYNVLFQDYGELESEHDALLEDYYSLESRLFDLEKEYEAFRESQQTGIPGFSLLSILCGLASLMFLRERTLK